MWATTGVIHGICLRGLRRFEVVCRKGTKRRTEIVQAVKGLCDRGKPGDSTGDIVRYLRDGEKADKSLVCCLRPGRGTAGKRMELAQPSAPRFEASVRSNLPAQASGRFSGQDLDVAHTSECPKRYGGRGDGEGREDRHQPD